MRIVMASDHGGLELKDFIKSYLLGKGYDILDIGTNSEESVDYPDYGKNAGLKIMNGEADLGIIMCGSGIGISIAANKVKGIRAALCHDIYTARMCKQHNNANILAMGGRIIGKGLAIEMVETYLNTEFEGGRHQRRIDKIHKIEQEG
ncbi:ribose 5-phosphate isomerase B [Haliovirga abyssi]|uniref:Ribose-5-phosphate isomerase n=1 Tax=Haliovirga abyssi TaxID=2996794 RepID=A0AAU9D357_9FUSO|nr:ribose 5-phosphate isomerase B [Haliovirga abyssi]BDU50434.1 ribose-5-phosphate isomerase [Haliovirga abyssi]